MAKVRVYDLAKEFGMKSKELADRLLALGYPIASHSSSVEEDMAADIRKKLRSDSVMASEAGGRIEMKNRPETPAPSGRAIIRRRPRAEKEEAAKKQEEAELQALEAEAKALEARLLAEKEAQAAVGASSLESEPENLPSGMAAPPREQDTAPPKEQVQEPQQQGLEPESLSPTETVAEQPNLAPLQTALEEKNILVLTQRQPMRKGAAGETPRASKKEQEANDRSKPLARIVGRVVIPVQEPPQAKTEQRRPARPAVSRPGSPAARPEPAVRAESERADSKGKKKTKRIAPTSTDEEDTGKKGVKGAKKGKSNVRVDLVQEGDGDFIRPRKGKKKKDARREAAQQPIVAETKAIKKRIKVVVTITVGDLAKRMGVKANEVITVLMKLGILATLNQPLDVDTASVIATEFGYEVEQAMTEELEVEALQDLEVERGGEALPRPPVVTVMGHVDHGKTSILDAIRHTDVALGEAGGITQHIGAYHVQGPAGPITFVDTPGHAAFTAMRSRGAKVTDVVVLVVAADDGVMNQTKEAIAHSKAAEVPIVVAVNKIDKDSADPERVKRELSEYGLIPEAWGGDTIYCETSAKKRVGIKELLESIQLQADVLELRADPSRKAKGTVIEAQLHKGRGPVATVLVQDGTLRPGDHLVAGMYSGKVRMLTNERSEQIQEAGPSIPVEVQGLSGVPHAGDEFVVLPDEKMAKAVASARQLKAREIELATASKVSLDNLFEKIAEQEMKELRVVLRADVHGTLQAFGQAAENLSTEVVRVRSLHEGTGSITESDIHLAAASNAIIIGFNVRPSVKVKELAEREGVDVRSYDVIYHALEDIEKAMKGMLEPTFEERVIGTAEVRDTFQVPRIGIIAGCAVIAGKMERNARVRLLRDGVVIYTGKISSLRRFKDDVKEVLTGFECGIGVENYNDIKVGDHLEAFVLDEVAPSL